MVWREIYESVWDSAEGPFANKSRKDT
jgi:hypothetical protein